MSFVGGHQHIEVNRLYKISVPESHLSKSQKTLTRVDNGEALDKINLKLGCSFCASFSSVQC